VGQQEIRTSGGLVSLEVLWLQAAQVLSPSVSHGDATASPPSPQSATSPKCSFDYVAKIGLAGMVEALGVRLPSSLGPFPPGAVEPWTHRLHANRRSTANVPVICMTLLVVHPACRALSGPYTSSNSPYSCCSPVRAQRPRESQSRLRK
jgi:hypothetical protein